MYAVSLSTTTSYRHLQKASYPAWTACSGASWWTTTFNRSMSFAFRFAFAIHVIDLSHNNHSRIKNGIVCISSHVTCSKERIFWMRVTCCWFCMLIKKPRDKNLFNSQRRAPKNRCQAKKFQFRSKLTWRMQWSATVEGGLLVAHSVGLSCSREGKIFLILQV